MNRMMLPGVNFPVTGRVSANSVDMDAVLLAGIIKDNPVTVELIAPFGMRPEILVKLQETWNAFKGPVSTTRKFSVFYEIGETRGGYVVIELRWTGALDVGVHVYDEDDEELDGSPMWASDVRAQGQRPPPVSPTMDIRANFDLMWDKVVPVEQIKLREKVTPPNAPCVCGSGKKYKKCCGRLV